MLCGNEQGTSNGNRSPGHGEFVNFTAVSWGVDPIRPGFVWLSSSIDNASTFMVTRGKPGRGARREGASNPEVGVTHGSPPDWLTHLGVPGVCHWACTELGSMDVSGILWPRQDSRLLEHGLCLTGHLLGSGLTWGSWGLPEGGDGNAVEWGGVRTGDLGTQRLLSVCQCLAACRHRLRTLGWGAAKLAHSGSAYSLHLWKKGPLAPVPRDGAPSRPDAQCHSTIVTAPQGGGHTFWVPRGSGSAPAP